MKKRWDINSNTGNFGAERLLPIFKG
ncbi:MAG: hypothetical protein ACD_24C00462G0006, partial [uncultured bacterium]